MEPEDVFSGGRVAHVSVREYKDVDLTGGTLLVSIPQVGLGNVLLTDHVLERYAMDQVAALDADGFPPIAMVRKGKARYPVRIHADPASRLAVLRCEFPPPAAFARGIARAVLGWVQRRGLARIVVLEHVRQERPTAAGETPAGADGDGAGRRQPRTWGVASLGSGRAALERAGLAEIDGAVLSGVLAPLVLEGRFEEVEVMGLLAEMRDPLEGSRGALAFAEVLPQLVPGLALDEERLRSESLRVDEALRAMQADVERALRDLGRPEPSQEEMPIYG